MMTEKPDRQTALKEAGISAAWIMGTLLVIGLLWLFTQPVRERRFIRTVNRVLMQNEDPRRLTAAISAWGLPGRAGQLGSRFETDTPGKIAVVFSMVNDGIPLSCLTFVSENGTVESLIPLSNHASAVMDRIPEITRQTYIRRIESGERILRAKEQP
ncbi:hypothetical protein [Breznakiella homolactica]|uniref:Uncharacterized protein n=1 Tax=Breznakiella homolactica TaxID=2798577 RepID=A0A7T7XKC5_9SPIR|nr:hypothetical protein [Breznakiella homolactica]QQO07951.1 hypothetical protein JFL75_13495 [Breznakiella homolactica]